MLFNKILLCTYMYVYTECRVYCIGDTSKILLLVDIRRNQHKILLQMALSIFQ